MAKRKVENVALLNELTGEIYDVFLSKRQWQGGKWMKIWQDGKVSLLSRSPQLSKEGFRVLGFLDAVVDWENVIPTPPVLAKRFGFNEKAVYRAYAELIRAGFIIKEAHSYFLNPLYCWKGSQKQYEEACQKLFSTKRIEAETAPMRLE